VYRGQELNEIATYCYGPMLITNAFFIISVYFNFLPSSYLFTVFVCLDCVIKV